VETTLPREVAETFPSTCHIYTICIAARNTQSALELLQEVASVADVETAFPREVAETFLRCKREGFDQTNAIIELNALKIAEDRTFADCARYIFTTILGAAPTH